MIKTCSGTIYSKLQPPQINPGVFLDTKETENTDILCWNLVEHIYISCSAVPNQNSGSVHKHAAPWGSAGAQPIAFWTPLIISLNICPMPPWGSEKWGPVWLMIQNHSPESLNTSASATLFHIVINSRNLSGWLTRICFNVNNLIL